jgi:hypothetical protein
MVMLYSGYLELLEFAEKYDIILPIYRVELHQHGNFYTEAFWAHSKQF